MANENLNDAKEWLSFAEADLGVATHLLATYNPNRLKSCAFTASRRPKKLSKH